MSELSKILATIGVVVLFVIIFGAIVGSMSDAGQTPGILGLIVFGALIGALRAIWKKPKNNEKKTTHPFFRSKAKSECSKTIIRYWVFLFQPPKRR